MTFAPSASYRASTGRLTVGEVGESAPILSWTDPSAATSLPEADYASFEVGAGKAAQIGASCGQ